MKEQLKLLQQLQRHDARLQEMEAAKKAFPEKLEATRKDLAKLEDMLGRERAELEEAERWRRERETELKAQEGLIARSKQKLSAVKNTKEFHATEKEAETLRRLQSETQEKLGQILEAADKARQRIDAKGAAVAQLRELAEREERESREQVAVIDREMAKVRAEREAEARAIRPDVMKKYGAIRMRRGIAVAAARAGTCTGCNMNIPPQLFNQLQRANSIETCPTCHRIIYWDKLFEEQSDGAPSEPAAKQESP